MNKNLKTISFAFAMFAVVGMISSTSIAFADDDELELEAKFLDNLQNEVGEAEFEVEDGQTEFEIEIESLPGAECTVTHDPLVGDTTSIDITLDDEGEYEESPSPFEIVEGDTITVVCNGNEFSNTFALEVDDEDDDDEEDDDDDDDDDHLEIESSSNKKPKKIRG